MNHPSILRAATAVLFALATSVFAENIDVTITVSSVDAMDVSANPGAITLNQLTAGSTTITGTDDTSTTLSYSHNSSAARKVTVNAATAQNGSSQDGDITLKISCAGKNSNVVVVNAGDGDGVAAADLANSVTAAAPLSGAQLTYNASCTTSCPTGTWTYTVVYTTAAQ